jgi:hypothetical protein
LWHLQKSYNTSNTSYLKSPLHHSPSSPPFTPFLEWHQQVSFCHLHTCVHHINPPTSFPSHWYQPSKAGPLLPFCSPILKKNFNNHLRFWYFQYMLYLSFFLWSMSYFPWKFRSSSFFICRVSLYSV